MIRSNCGAFALAALSAAAALAARPVDCVECAGGSLLFSDDHTSRVYRLTRTGE